MSQEHYRNNRVTPFEEENLRKPNKQSGTKKRDSKPPENLLRLINLLNLLPVRVEYDDAELNNPELYPVPNKLFMPDVPNRVEFGGFKDGIFSAELWQAITSVKRHEYKTKGEYLEAQRNKFAEFENNCFREAFSFLAPEIQDYIYQPNNELEGIQLIESNYKELIEAYGTVRSAIEYQAEKETFFLSLEVRNFVIVSANKNIVVKKSFVADALDGVNINRLRICPICEKFFWARQINMMTCSKPCANLRRVRKHRSKSADYEFNRYQKEQKRARK